MIHDDTIAGRMALWLHARHNRGPFAAGPEGRRLARMAITDAIGCLYAGRDDATVRKVAGAAHAPGMAWLVTGGDADPAMAAMVNGTAAHALDYDDNFTPGMSHASAVIVPALLAVCDRARPGRDLVDAYLVALQAQAFVGAGVGPGHYAAGWHGTSTVGSVGTAAGVAHLLGGDAEGLRRALTLACSFACGTKGQFGTPAKPFHAGLAARNAVEAARLAMAGLEGSPQAFEGSQGFAEMFRGRGTTGYVPDAIDATTVHVIETDGVVPKLHPCCGSTHLIVDALADLRNAAPIHADHVKAIDVKVGIANHRNLPYTHPENEMQARFSMNYCIAVALRSGKLTLNDFTAGAVAARRHDPLLSRLSMTSWSAEDEAGTDGTRLPHQITLHMVSGDTHRAERLFPRGDLREPFPDAAMKDKFHACCDYAPWAGSVHDALMALDEASDLRPYALLFGRSDDPR
ncbi:MmgE/PrpD family protein [Paracoccus nototheniae]|uniref:MmgE/PrpD family protein n=1 Tax=Paracoccus nototheniae TaxID=2489002 RepID=A0ABW4DX32_9RHOB|nr:MmgE/PrpD family protein [Paracoccus nototheniae]